MGRRLIETKSDGTRVWAANDLPENDEVITQVS